MDRLLWVVQILLAAVFAFAGSTKAFKPVVELSMSMPWVIETPTWMVRTAGFAELVGMLGLIVPSATRIKPELTPLAALGLALVMVFAAILHISHGDYGLVLPNVVLFGASMLVWWGRTKKAPLAPK